MSQFVSYAQNFEDVMLWRALKHIQNGFYVDVGANDPKFDSVTQAFYERGWRGINIEPTKTYYEALCRERPGDINLNAAAAGRMGEITLYEIPESGLSTMDIATAKLQEKNGWKIQTQKISAYTLDKIFQDYIRTEIHFLKIDVEGAEKEVLNGLDLSRWRPWILVVEATIPSSQNLNYEVWELSILSAGFNFVYFDGINRFYVAQEHPELVDSFQAPPNPFDGYITIKQLNADQEISRLKHILLEQIPQLIDSSKEVEVLRSELNRLRLELDRSRFDLDFARKELDRSRFEIDSTRKEFDRSRFEIDSTRKELDQTRSDLDWARKELEPLKSELVNLRQEREQLRAVLSQHQIDLENARASAEYFRYQYINVLYSKSYRITAPLRSFYILLKKFRRAGLVDGPSQNVVEKPIEPKIEAPTDEDVQYYLDLFHSGN